MKVLFNIIILLLLDPLNALAKGDETRLERYKTALVPVDRSSYVEAFAFLNQSQSDESEVRAMLSHQSDLVLLHSDVLGAKSSIIQACKLEADFIRLGLFNTPVHHLNCARLGYYYTLTEQFEEADSLTQQAYVSLKSFYYTPQQKLEIYSYRAGYLLSRLNCTRSLDYDYKDYKKIKANFIRKARLIIDEGLNIAKVHNIQSSVFCHYLLSMKERIKIDDIRAFVFRHYSENETNFKLFNNTVFPASYLLQEYYNSIVKNIQNGEIIESLKFLEPLVQVSVECRGETHIASLLYSLISDLYLNLYNFSKAMKYAQMSRDVDKRLGVGAYADSDFHSSQINSINSLQEEYDNVKFDNPLYAFENALMNQGSLRAQDARFGYIDNAIGNYLSDENNIFDFDKLINEAAWVHRFTDLEDFKLQSLNSYKINPHVSIKSSIIYPLGLDESMYYEILRHYSPSLNDAKKIISNKLRTSNNIQEKSRFYHLWAKYNFYIGNNSEAIAAQQTHLNMELSISENKYTKNVLDAQRTLSQLNMLGMWNAFGPHGKKQVKRFQESFIRIGADYIKGVKTYIEDNFASIDESEQRKLWSSFSNWFFNTTPYMGINGSAAECIYNSILFSKGLLLSAAIGTIPNYCWSDVKDALKNDDMAIEFISFRNIMGEEVYYAVSITSDDKEPVIHPLFTDFEYEDLDIIDEKCYEDSRMFDLVIRPIEIPERINNIYFSPTGVLNTIAIENIVDSLGIRSCEKWNMYRLTSTRELLSECNSVTDNSFKGNALIVGDLDYNCSLDQNNDITDSSKPIAFDRFRGVNRAIVQPLLYSKPEVDSIASLTITNNISTQVISGSGGTEEALKFYCQKPINILHLSTHGFFYSDEQIKENDLESDKKYKFLFREEADNPEDLAMTRSALVMSGGNNTMRGIQVPIGREDGLLTAMEISKLSLDYCDLVSLSACETALGKVSQEGVYGLQRGFKIAGAKSILMSLWKVPDDATCRIMQEFYNNLFDGQTKIDALKNAQTTIKADPNFENPSNWAGWILLDALN